MTGWPSETRVPGAIIKRTRSPESMFSPSSGSLNSLLEPTSPDEAEGANAEAVRVEALAALEEDVLDEDWADAAAATLEDVGFADSEALAEFGAGAACFAGRAPFSTVKMTCPTLSLSPSLTRISPTVPVTDEGTSTTALSVSSSMTGWPSVTLAPGLISRRTRSPLSMFSPSSGSLNSVAIPTLSRKLKCQLLSRQFAEQI